MGSTWGRKSSLCMKHLTFRAAQIAYRSSNNWADRWGAKHMAGLADLLPTPSVIHSDLSARDNDTMSGNFVTLMRLFPWLALAFIAGCSSPYQFSSEIGAFSTGVDNVSNAYTAVIIILLM